MVDHGLSMSRHNPSSLLPRARQKAAPEHAVTPQQLHEITSEFLKFLRGRRLKDKTSVEKISTKNGNLTTKVRFSHQNAYFPRKLSTVCAHPVKKTRVTACPIPTSSRAKTTSIRAKATSSRAGDPKSPKPFFHVFQTFIQIFSVKSYFYICFI